MPFQTMQNADLFSYLGNFTSINIIQNIAVEWYSQFVIGTRLSVT